MKCHMSPDHTEFACWQRKLISHCQMFHQTSHVLAHTGQLARQECSDEDFGGMNCLLMKH